MESPTAEDVKRMNAALDATPTSRFCATQAVRTGESLKVVRHKFDGCKEEQLCVVRADKDGNVTTTLAGLKSPPVIPVRTPCLQVGREFARLSRLASATQNPSQMFEVGADGACGSSEAALRCLDVRKAWAKEVYTNGATRLDPRFKQIESKRKSMQFDEFKAYFFEMLELPGAPFCGALAKFDETNAMVLRAKPWTTLWDEKDDETGEYDDVIDDPAALRAMNDRRCRITPVKLYQGGEVVAPAEYDSIVSRIAIAYFNVDVKLVWSGQNKLYTMMITPREVVIGFLGESRSGNSTSAERPVDIMDAMKRKPDADVVDILTMHKKKKRAKQ